MSHTVNQLRATARGRGIKGFSKLKKQELLEVLGMNNETETEPETVEIVETVETVDPFDPLEVKGEESYEDYEQEIPADVIPTSVKAIRDILKARGYSGISKTKKEDLMKMFEGTLPAPEKVVKEQNSYFLALAEYRRKNPSKSPIIKKGSEEYEEVRKLQEEIQGSKEAMQRGKKIFS